MSQRLHEAIESARTKGFSGLLAASNGHNSFLESNAVYALTGFRGISETVLLASSDGDVVLVVSPEWDAGRARRITGFENVIGTDRLAVGVGQAADMLGLAGRAVQSVGLSTLGNAVVRDIGDALGATPVADDDLVRDLARIRFPEELALVKKATQIADAGYDALLEIARPGMREHELAAHIYCEMKALGAEDNFLLMSASQHNLAVRAAGQRVLEEGDIILAEITPCYHGQFVQICRTAVLGEPNPIVGEKFAILQSAMRAGQAAAVPGATVSQVTAVLNGVFQEAGYGDYCRPPYMRVRGHGLGITSNRPGDLVQGNDTVLEEGMVFVMHPNQYIPESGYLLCGETVVVSPMGAQTFSNASAELDIIGV